MGRVEPSYAPMAQQSHRKDQRAKNARATINQTIPQLLASDNRARKGIENAHLFAGTTNKSNVATGSGKKSKQSRREASKAQAQDDSRVLPPTSATKDDSSFEPLKIRIQVTDALGAAQELHHSSRSKKNVAILNMASPLRPGGGVLNGATSQEEYLCSRTSLLTSLREEWYRLPEIGGIWSPDVLVFRLGNHDLPKNERFYVDVVSAAMIRFPDVVESVTHQEAEEDIDSGSEHTELSDKTPNVPKSYASQADRDLALEKMRAVLGKLVSERTERVVLGAWGCGAYGNPINEVCAAWQRALLGTRKTRKSNAINLGKLQEVVFAIKDPRMAQEFAQCWGEGITLERREKSSQNASDDIDELLMQEVTEKIAALEVQIVEARTPMLKQGLEGTLRRLKQELADIDKGKADGDEHSED